MIVLQLMGLCFGSGAAIWALMSVVYPIAYRHAVERFGQEYCDTTMKSLSPVLWFSVGYLVVVALRSRVSDGDFFIVFVQAFTDVCNNR